MELEILLSQKGLVHKSPTLEEIRQRASEESPIKLFYGETYDHAGNTIDSMKYYFFVADLADSLREEGFYVEPTILIADTAACRNVNSDLEYKYMQLGEARTNFVREINEVYRTNLKIIKMSDYINSKDFTELRTRLIEGCKDDAEILGLIEKSVPESKIEIERAKGFMYSWDEVATIIDLDVKVGPPREDLYDNIARKISEQQGMKQLMSLFLTPAFPLGKNWAYFFANEGIEEYGITAYKGDSKRLRDHRILVGRINADYLSELIDKSFISKNPRLPNPVLDVGIISEIARQRLTGDRTPIKLWNQFYEGSMSSEELKSLVKNQVNDFILERLR